MATVYITEEQEQELLNNYLKESLIVNSAQVKDIKNYLNKSYRVNPDYDDIGVDGLPKETVYITYYIQGKPKMNLKREDLLDVIADKFKHFVKDDAARYAYMNQILSDWMANKIKPTGQLSVNYIDDKTIEKFKNFKRQTKQQDSKQKEQKSNNNKKEKRDKQ